MLLFSRLLEESLALAYAHPRGKVRVRVGQLCRGWAEREKERVCAPMGNLTVALT